MLYRLYSEVDFPALYAIEEVCFAPPLRFGRGMMRRLIGCPNSATWIAERDGAMAGFGIVEWDTEAGETVAYLETIEVLPELRGMGVGYELLRRLDKSACEAGAVAIGLHVDAENTVAIGLYEAHGFALKGRQEDYYGSGRAALIYSKRLGARAAGL